MARRIIFYSVLVIVAGVAGLALGAVLMQRATNRESKAMRDMLSHTEANMEALWKFSVLDKRGTAKTCPVHQARLVLDVVPISYGLAVADPTPDAVRRKEFPFANTRCLGGCVHGEGSPKQALVLYCPACRQAEGDWMRGHRQKND